VYEQSSCIANSASLVAENDDSYFTNSFQRNEFIGLTQNEIDKLANYAEGLKAGRSTID
jgi:hypothetical protein